MKGLKKPLLKRDLSKGNIIIIHNNTDIIGTGLLLTKLYNGLPYINEDTKLVTTPIEIEILGEKQVMAHKTERVSLKNYPVYNYQKWKVKLIKSENENYVENEIYTFNIPYLVGYFNDKNLPGSYDIDDEEYLKWCKDENKLIDKFIEIDGVELF